MLLLRLNLFLASGASCDAGPEWLPHLVLSASQVAGTRVCTATPGSSRGIYLVFFNLTFAAVANR